MQGYRTIIASAVAALMSLATMVGIDLGDLLGGEAGENLVNSIVAMGSAVAAIYFRIVAKVTH